MYFYGGQPDCEGGTNLMREQIANRSPVPRRATATSSYLPANPHRAGHQSGLHPEDQPYQSTELEEDEQHYPRRPASSAIRYQTTEGNQVIQQGHRRLVIHQGPPPKPKRRVHWLFFLGLGMISMFLVWLLLQSLTSWWTSYQLNTQYGFPRTYQTDERVGFGDSLIPTHFIALNLNGQIEVIVCPAGNCTRATIYPAVHLFGDNAANVPVTVSFADLSHTGRLDMIVHIGDQQVVFLNNGTQFKPQ